MARTREQQDRENGAARRRRAENPEKARAKGREDARIWRTRHSPRKNVPPGPKRKYSDVERLERAAAATERWRARNPESALAHARESMRAFRARDPEGARAYQEKWNADNPLRAGLSQYKLRPEDFARLLSEQGGVCAICQKPETNRTGRKSPGANRLTVDHCHKLGIVRGLLCFKCNVALGHFREDPLMLTAAIHYLQKVRQ